MPVLLNEIYTLSYSIAVGFVAAGIVSSFYQMMTSEPARFAVLGNSAMAWLVTFLFCALTGPFIIMRNAIRARRIERRPVGWLMASAGIAGLWSCCSGIVVLYVALIAQSLG